MDRYKIYCTEEQTRKSLKLGAPLNGRPIVSGVLYELKKFYIVNNIAYIIPSAEQLIGWLEEQGILIDIHFYCVSWDMGTRTKTGHIISQKMSIETRKEATLAAIDAALEYLENLKH